ncbi:MAG: hypothetical protein NPIRA05_05370 [Nitrospirales bacterium]|nr:MAG: hypothetical protein NPIRA05_05370 [Nitrospirales bacterium]
MNVCPFEYVRSDRELADEDVPIDCMEFVVSRDPRLLIQSLIPSLSRKALPGPVKGSVTSYHFWARNALFHGLGALGLQPGDKVLVPAFHCSTVVEPILHYGCVVVFYHVNRDGIVDFEDMARKVDSLTKAVLAIHYFGVLQPVKTIREFCHHHQLFFIEDCAHLLMGEGDDGPLGSVGDISIFSWRKFFPIYDGGMLVCNQAQMLPTVPWDGFGGWLHLKIVKNLFEKYLSDRSAVRLPVVLNCENPDPEREDCVSEAEVRAKLQPKTLSAEFDALQINWPMSPWSRFILEHIDLPAVMQKRQEHSKFLNQALGEVSGVRPWSTAGVNGVCAWAFPIVSENRTDLHIQLRKRGIQSFSWDGVIHPSLPLEEFQDARFLYERLVLLPNHQSLTQEELHFVIESVKDVL